MSISSKNHAASALLVFLSVVFIPVPALADSGWVVGKVTRVMITEADVFGGCLIKTDANLGASLNCSNPWISLDCEAQLGGSKSEASRRLDAAQLAMISKTSTQIRINDSLKLNGWCVADRIVLAAPR